MSPARALPDAHLPGRAAGLRAGAEDLGARASALLLSADHLAGLVQMGAHGRRRAGAGEAFWQYRPAQAGDTARMIDWRRSARADTPFVREREAEVAQSLLLWVDGSASMALHGKAARARLLALALALLALRAGEAAGIAGAPLRRGHAAGGDLALHLEAAAGEGAADDPPEFGAPAGFDLPANGRALAVSDFLGDPAPVDAFLARAAASGVRGVLLQVLDPAEEAFPFTGRMIFESPAATRRRETQEAAELAVAYRARLAERRAQLDRAARGAGWVFGTHHLGQPPAAALLWAQMALSAPRPEGRG
ncbi:DUF58 domain-containing protein [Phaeovulum vinaykumarii]|uniref:DUF58 domain-containing protein n=1 Tax=Phaeovulum vinaykumarii TaxID=407234 RepID=A0A1N7KRQ7_9RHOB|nr:DUF58 domain-containing protein [Phaeovulum vinaykumarii]SIS64254.1 Protein of unknown function DUF58 [Phaeovulum vinaykumarii]SOC01632.1 uncharacterized protein DUF58 [Phaeovulum vinaykumarii]